MTILQKAIQDLLILQVAKYVRTCVNSNQLELLGSFSDINTYLSNRMAICSFI